jgi:hypothetical protein
MAGSCGICKLHDKFVMISSIAGHSAAIIAKLPKVNTDLNLNLHH